MIEVCRQTNNKDGLLFWQYSLRLTAHLTDGAMSEDEDGFQIVEIGSREKRVQIKLTRDLHYRHPAIAAHYDQVDATPGIDEVFFHATGKQRMERVRVPHDYPGRVRPPRDPPKGLSAAVYRPGYLDKLLPHERSVLQLSQNHFPLYQTSGERSDGDSMEID